MLIKISAKFHACIRKCRIHVISISTRYPVCSSTKGGLLRYTIHLLYSQSLEFEICILLALQMPLIHCTNIFYQWRLSSHIGRHNRHNPGAGRHYISTGRRNPGTGRHNPGTGRHNIGTGRHNPVLADVDSTIPLVGCCKDWKYCWTASRT